MNVSGTNTVEFAEISKDRAGQRLDNFLLCYLRGAPRSLIYRILRKGEVRVNKGRAKPSYKLQLGDIVRIPPVKRIEAVAIKPADLQAVSYRLQEAILLENDDFIAVNKPSGLAVHGGSGLRYGLIEILKSQATYAELELVHRLDRQTSGCLLLARSRSCLGRLHALLRDRQIEKHYLALLQGELRKPMTIDTELVRLQRGNERIVSVADTSHERSKSALTHIKPLHVYSGTTLVDVQIDTGRTHQIRVHCASVHHPLAGDEKYGSREFNKTMRGLGLKRLFLHAASLQFKMDGVHKIEAPLPDGLVSVLDKLDEK